LLASCRCPRRTPRPPGSTLFPYTTLFRSHRRPRRASRAESHGGRQPAFPGIVPDGACRRGRVGATLIILHRAAGGIAARPPCRRSEEHTSELQSRENLVCRLLLEKKNHKD